MSDINLDIEGARRSIQEVDDKAESMRQAHQSKVPIFPTTAAGKGFVHHAERLQTAFDLVHQRGERRLAEVVAMARSAQQQISQVENAEEANAQHISSVWSNS